MPLTPAGLLGFPTVPGHRPPLFYIKLKLFLQKIQSFFGWEHRAGGQLPPTLLVLIERLPGPLGQGTVQVTCGLASAVPILPP